MLRVLAYISILLERTNNSRTYIDRIASRQADNGRF
jgi:hypothetical protein